MTARPNLPEGFDENPLLAADFSARARPAATDEAAGQSPMKWYPAPNGND